MGIQKRWSISDEEIGINLLKEGKGFVEISILLKKSYNSVRCHFNRLGYSTLKRVAKIINCMECGKEFYKNETVDGVKIRRIKFCSVSCSVRFSNKRRIRKKRVNEIKCLNCDNTCKGQATKYCSKECLSNFIEKTSIEKIKNNISSGLGEYSIRRYMIKIHGAKCMKCGWNMVNEFTGKVPIEMNHKDGNSNNHNYENLELICPNCHSLTNNYRALNKGNGRHNRKQRARDGKSF